MVDVAEKPRTLRRAVSRSEVRMSDAAFERLSRIDADKGDVIAAARIAGIMAAKRTADLIPLCHPIALSKVTVDFELDAAAHAVLIVATAEAVDRTGVEMESLVAASVAGLTIYDMLKSIDRGMLIGPTALVEKSGGRSGHYKR
jgi:cyclic pyranopterin phosphate synthase